MKNQNFEKMKKPPGCIITLPMCNINENHTMYGSWDMEYDRHNFLSFWTAFCHLYYHFTHVYYKWQSYGIWFLKYGPWQTQFFVILEDFLHFFPPNNPKNQNFEKMKKPHGDVITLLLCTINDNHMMYGYIWFLKYGVWQTQFFVILEDFLHFHPPNNPKNQNFEKIKKPRGDIITLQLCTINDNHMMYGSWDMECDKHNFLSFWTVFCPFTL